MDYTTLVNQFFSAFNLSPAQINLDLDDDTLNITLNVPESESGRYIGRYATTLDALQLILSLMINNNKTDHLHINIDVGGYRKERQIVLTNMAERIGAAVLETKTPHSFPPLSATDRRSLHLLFQDHESLTTYSQGEGQHRRLILAPKS